MSESRDAHRLGAKGIVGALRGTAFLATQSPCHSEFIVGGGSHGD
jgi:hypothetical protein